MKHTLKSTVMKQTQKILLAMLSLPAMLLSSLSLTAQVVPTNDSFPAATTASYVPAPAVDSSVKVSYVRTREFSEPIPYYYNNDYWGNSDTLPIRNGRETVQYMDALGRPWQTVQKQLTPAGKDIVSQTVYDDFSRPVRQYLPSPTDSSKGAFVRNFGYQQAKNMTALYDSSWLTNPSLHPTREKFFYSATGYESSPRSRPVSSMQAGNGWIGMDRSAYQAYLHNLKADSVRIWTIGTASGSYPQTTAIYDGGDVYSQHGTLFKDSVTDEQGVKTVEFKDLEGHLILKKQQIAATTGAYNGWLCTYYVYDDFGRLRYVIPPKAVDLIRAGSWSLSNATIRDELCFRYEYDGRGRTIVRKVPGAREEYMVYDRRDRLVFSQDGRSRTAHQWLVTFYDGQDRPVETGLYNSTAARSTLQAMMDTVSSTSAAVTYSIPAPGDLAVNSRSGNTPATYTARSSITFLPGFSSGTGDSFVTSIDPNAVENSGTVLPAGAGNPVPPIAAGSVTPLTYTYYDDYSWSGHQAFNQTYLNRCTAAGNLYPENTHPFEDNNNTSSNRTTGLVTGMRVRVLNSNPEQWLTTTLYYDERARVVQSLSDNISGGTDVVSTKYDFEGKVLSTYTVEHDNLSGVTPETRVLTEYLYDDAGRLLTVKKKLNDSGTSKQIARYAYDALGRLASKTLGSLETLRYDYNVHGWLRGINRDYANGSGSHYFGMELDYDYGFSQPQYTGNIAGQRWRTSGDGARRAYGFSYDLASRLGQADFRQYTSGSWNLNANVDYSVSNLAYDANGNIKSMLQKGLISTTSGTVDNMAYTYRNSGTSNQLDNVTDNGTSTVLGDFKDGHSGAGDYAYDSSGNLTKDLNKAMAGITYNHLNLPETITVTGKGTIRFVYDAAGNKLRKIVTDNTDSQHPNKKTTTDYLAGFVYQNDTLQLLPTEEGRIRYVPAHGTTAASYVYDYFVRDHLNNVRVVLTEQTDFTQYLATMEPQNAQTEDALFANVDNTREAKPMDYPQDETTSPNTAVARLNGSDPDKRVGPSIILKVMAGDTIEAAVRAFYRQQATTQNNAGVPAEDMAASLMQALSLPVQAAAGTHALNPEARLAAPQGGLTSNDLNDLKNKDPQNKREDKPKAYLNYVFFDNQFNFVEDGSGVKQVDSDPNQLETLASGKVVAKENGYVYVYTSNESQQDVLFDNMGVMQITGPVLEETHYYPYGLTMAGISTTAPLKLENRFKYNGIELNHKEFSDESGLDLYSAYFRDLDPQIGRWWQVDPRTTYNLSPYASMNSNPISLVDVLGDTTGLPDAYKGNYNIYSNNILDELIVGGYGNSNYGMNGPLYTGVFFAPTKFIKDDSYNPNLVRTTFTNKVTTEDPKIFYSSLGDRLEINVSNETVTGKEGSILTTNVTYENGEISDVSLALGYKQVKLTHAFDGKNFGIYLGFDLSKTKASFGLSSKGFTSNFTFPNGASSTEIQTYYMPGGKSIALVVGATVFIVPESVAILPSAAAEIFGSLITK